MSLLQEPQVGVQHSLDTVGEGGGGLCFSQTGLDVASLPAEWVWMWVAQCQPVQAALWLGHQVYNDQKCRRLTSLGIKYQMWGEVDFSIILLIDAFQVIHALRSRCAVSSALTREEAHCVPQL